MHSKAKKYQNSRVWNRERFIRGPWKEMVLGLRNPKATERFQQSPFKSKKVREGCG